MQAAQSPAKSPAKRLLAYALCASLACPLPVRAFNENLTDIANSPVTQPASTSMQPNILLILDDSGSMARQFMPDYISTTSSGTFIHKNCFDSLDAGTTNGAGSANLINNTLDECWAGDPPAMSPDFNSQYYNPEFRYRPAVDYTGIERISMTAANTANWTAVPTDNVSAATNNFARKDLTSGESVGSSAGNWGASTSPVINTMNLTTQWPDRVWCTDTGDLASDTARCATNSAYTYPNAAFGYGLDAAGKRKYKFGAPYYYRIVPTEFCTDAYMNNCKPLCAVTGGVPPACITSSVAPGNVIAGTSYAVPAPVRFCTDSTLATCHAKRSISLPDRRYPKFAGNATIAGAATPAVKAKGTITIPVQADQNSAGTVTASQANITSIVVTKTDPITLVTTTTDIFSSTNPNTIGSSPLALTAGQTNSQWATAIAGRSGTVSFNNLGFAEDYTISAATNVVTITAVNPGNDHNGATIAVNTNVTATTPAFFTWTFSSTVQNSACTGSPLSCGNVSSLIVDGVQFAPVLIKCNVANCNSATAATRDAAMRDQVYNNIVLPAGWSKSKPTATGLTITAPTGLTPIGSVGSAMNGRVVSMARLNTVAATAGVLIGGATTGDIQHTIANFSGGANTIPPGTVRSDVGDFERTNIVPGPTYNAYPDRTDCVALANVCTYAEEMTNFANWFSYYRTRGQMAKSSIGRAFALAGIGDNFRVGFVTINFSTTKYLATAAFTTGVGGQKDLWFQKLYAAPASGGTPLRDALSRAGRYFGDRFNGVASSMGASPINSACQPNYTILTSDGYWNDSGTVAQKLDGTAIGDSDGDGKSNTLADVADYYYKTDLRPIPPVAPSTVGFKDQVPPSGDDTAPHQHMTTFTVGIGVQGSLLFHPNYQTPGNSPDYDTIVGIPGGAPGTNAWPTPVADTDTTVDDLWHAAVNGKGRFFGAQNPVALAAGINEVLTSVQKRIGAGAAAATSNLQPVAGDNFGFTAQYQTVDWSGDLKARTISLSDGIIGARELWSAQAQLDLRTFGDRVIYTFDEADTNASLTVVVDGVTRSQNGNKLRSFCRPDAPAGTYPTCTDGGLITIAEKDAYFDPLGGPNGALGQAAGWPGGDPRRTAASASNNTYLFRYLRGERAREITLGGTSSTDLYRARAAILGDIVNAQPAYVKASPFAYSAATDPFYTTFQASTNGQSGVRKGTVYVAANDGMLHAFETDPDNIPYYQNAGVSTVADSTDDTFTGTLSTDPVAGEGAERWAYVPQLIFPTMKRLAEENYSTNHKFFTDGSPAIGDVCFGHTLATPCSTQNNWKTILVAGLNAGGRGFYALDITDPDNPKGLWEAAGGSEALVAGSVKCLTNAEANSGLYGVDCNIGLSFGNPIIAKRPEDGRWVVMFTSGYNNVNPGSGLGYLYMVDAQTGKILRRMSTSTGCAVNDNPDVTCVANTDDPSGLARINAWVDSATTDNTAKAVYGGDLKGNLWRFQLDDIVAVPRYSVTKLGTVEDDLHAAQPITVRPDLATVNSSRVIYFGTGKFLGDSDKPSLARQSIYAIKDDMSGVVSPQVSMVRTGPGAITGFVRQVLTEDTTSTRTVTTPQPVNFGTDKGWFIDLPDGGIAEEAAERVSVDPIIQLGTLVVASNVPSTETCLAGGSGWVNFLDIRTGAPVTGATSNPASVKISGSLIVGINIVKIGDQIKAIVTTADNQQLTKDTPVAATGVTGRRVSWRELIVE
jgi:type IV pilus assembly protein PilY1